MFYPIFEGTPRPCIQVAPGRWRSNKYSSWIEGACSRKQTLTRSTDKDVLLNTETLHRAMPVTDAAGVFRLIYSFAEWFKDGEQPRPIKNLSGNAMSINAELIAYYRERLAQAAS